MREIADKKIDLGKTWLSIVKNAQKYQPVEETDIDEDQAVPLNENASEMSFDNFEKENASEKKRKKIYMTQNEIQKLIDLSLIHISEPTRPLDISYAVFCLKKKFF